MCTFLALLEKCTFIDVIQKVRDSGPILLCTEFVILVRAGQPKSLPPHLRHTMYIQKQHQSATKL
jgi:hypothetical protein